MSTTRRRFGWIVTAMSAAFCVSADVSVVRAAQGASVSEGQGSVSSGVFTPGQAGRGEQTFKIICSACHTASDLTGSRFRSRWVDATVGDVFEFVSSAMPEGNPGSLTPGEYADVLAFVLRESGYPPGEQELPVDRGELSKMKIEAAPK